MSNTFQLERPVDNVQEFVANGSLAIDIGSLTYHVTDDARPATSLSDQGTEALNQAAFAAQFLGVARSARLVTDTAAGVVRIQTDGLYQFTCQSDTYEHGDLVGASENGNGDGLLNTTVEKVTDKDLAIGIAWERQASATTKIWCRLINRKTMDIAHKYGDAGALLVGDDDKLSFGDSNDVQISWNTTDANANELMLQLPAGTGVNVPVIIIGQSILDSDLAIYNGTVDPRVCMIGVGAVTTGPGIDFRKARGTAAYPTVCTSGDDVGTIRGYAAVAAGEYVQTAEIRFDVAGTIATTRGPGTITFLTATDAAPSVLTAALTISAAQLVTCAAGLTIGAGALTAAGTAYIGDTSNVGVTLGLTINQGAADDSILELKSSDVSHGMTGVTEDDTYARFLKFAATDGGLYIDGLADTGGTGLQLRGVMVTDTATRSTAGVAPVMIDAALKSTTTVTGNAADKNILCVRTAGTTRFILDSDGDSFQDVGTAWTNFDDHDDLTLLNSLAGAVARPGNPIAAGFGQWASANKAELEALKLVNFNEDTDSRAFVNMSKLTMLLTGAVRQLGLQLRDTIAELTEIKTKLLTQG